MRWRYLASRSMTSMASITLMAKTMIAFGHIPPLLVWGPPVGPVPPAPEEEDSPLVSVTAQLLQNSRGL
jgi:hypothetical protein